jgi:hypothetical protein
MKLLLFYSKKNVIIEVDENNIIDEMYNNLAVIPNKNQLLSKIFFR